MADRSELVAELKGWCRGEGLDEAHSLMVMVPEDVEIAKIEDTLHTVKCLGRVRVRGRTFSVKHNRIMALCECREQLKAETVPHEILPISGGEAWPVVIIDEAPTTADEFSSKLLRLLQVDAADVKSNLPEEFSDFPDTQVIIDCTEIRCQTPSSPLLQSEMYSNYKSHCTMKGLIGIAPHGPVTFVSQLYAGSVSDREIFKQCGITKRLTEDMAVMVDKGFLISDCVNCKVYCPPFLSRGKQMPAHQVKETQAIARLRVHVERVIRRIKQNKLFDAPLLISAVCRVPLMIRSARDSAELRPLTWHISRNLEAVTLDLRN
ncbi:hypothetical protein H4Q32_030933 [Labeo rohita]|uniref:DDE Tnp4 domain-containing protein n=1 Tax=Labeo rohita TaxID=84645 RepID=A0ABQ8L299_LABRO|nr:hypothetical protein H4Q32_030933 [Labeo rohita]